MVGVDNPFADKTASLDAPNAEEQKRQLELLYPNRHELRIEKGEKEFGVNLKLPLAQAVFWVKVF